MAGWWPVAPPIWQQVVLMLLVAELLRYPLHIAAHNTKTLWRLHAVHHSPKKLYWLNVGRFHPVEKSLQYVLDTLPFMLVGVGAEVVSLYFVFYAVNGFYQHSNVDVRYGPLNYIVSGPEPGTGERYKQHCVRQGQREGQFKIIALLYQSDCAFPFAEFHADVPSDRAT